MLFVIFVALTVIGFAVAIWGANLSYHPRLFKVSEPVSLIGGFIGCLSFIATAVSLGIIASAYIRLDADVDQMNKQYEFLTYQYENDIYESDFSKRELVKEIQEWNEDLAYKQAIQDNFWIGIFYPNIYDQFEFIELDEVNGE